MKQCVSLQSLCSELKCVHAIKAKGQTVAQLNSLPEQLSNGEITSEEAIERVDALVGKVLTRQAALVVINGHRSFLPRGWLEYKTDDGTPYFFHVYSQTTTWCVEVCSAAMGRATAASVSYAGGKLGGRRPVQMSVHL